MWREPFDEFVFDEFRQFAENHYVWAVKSVLAFIENWRQEFSIAIPMQYVFESGSLGEKQIERVWKECLLYKNSDKRYGIVPDGVQFQSKRVFKPLQAADILAWQVQNNMRRTVMIGRDPNDRTLEHEGFRILKDGRPMELLFYSREQVKQAFENTKASYQANGVWPWEPNSGVTFRARCTEPGTI